MLKSKLVLVCGLAAFTVTAATIATAPQAHAASPELEARIDRLVDALRETPASGNTADGPAVVSDTFLKAKFKIDELSKSACDRVAVLSWYVQDNSSQSVSGSASKKMKCKNGTCRAVVKAYAYVPDANLANLIEMEATVFYDCPKKAGGAYPYVPGTQYMSLPGEEVPQGGTQSVTFTGKI